MFMDICLAFVACHRLQPVINAVTRPSLSAFAALAAYHKQPAFSLSLRLPLTAYVIALV